MTTLEELRSSGRATCSVPDAGRAAFGVGASRSYELAAAGVIPVLHLGPRRLVVPVSRLLDLLGERHTSA